MKMLTKFGATSNMVRVRILDSSVTTGAGLTGVTFSSSGLVIDIIANNSPTAYHYKSAATATIEDITTIGTFAAPTALNCRFKAVDGTNFPGLYEIQFLDGVFDDAGCTSLIGEVKGVTNMAPCTFEIQLVAFDPTVSTAGGLPVVGTGTNNFKSDGSANVTYANAAPPTAAAIATGVWQDTTAGDFTTALSVGKSLMNGVALGTGLTINAYTGNTVQTGDAFGRLGVAGVGLTNLGDTRIANLDATVSSRLATAGYTAPSNLTAAQIATGIFQDTTAGDFTVALSVGKSIMNGVVLGTGLTVAAVTGGALEATLAAMKGATFSGATDSLEALRDRGDAAWTTATGFATTAEIADVPTVAEFNARTLAAADYTIVSDLGTVQTADHTAAISDLPTNAELATALGTADDAVLAAIAALNNLAAGAAMTLTGAERQAIADAWTARNVAGGSSAGRTNGQAMAVMRNKVEIAAGVMTVYDVDDTTPLFTAAITTAAGNPISTIDPA